MGWQKRGNGRSYDSLVGHCSMIGHRSKKVLGYQVKTRKCWKCDRGKPHKCFGVFLGSAKAMEPAGAVDLMTDKNPLLKKNDIKVSCMIGDDDSSTIHAVRKNCPQKVSKWSDLNHGKKGLANALYSLKPKFKELDTPVIKYLTKCFGYALAQNLNDPEATSSAIKNIVDHAFGSHDNCKEWCQFKKNPEGYKHNGLPNGEDLKNENLKKELKTIFDRFAANSERLSHGGSTQRNENFNAIVVSKAPKKTFYGGSFSHHTRVAAAVCQTNIGTKYVYNAYQRLGFRKSTQTEKYRDKKDEARLKLAEMRKGKKAKMRRNHLRKIRSSKRENTEKKEGRTYESDMGFSSSQHLLEDYIPNAPIVNNDSEIVYFDIETTGLHKKAEILQIAAKNKNTCFSEYAYPKNNISAVASEVTGLKLIDGELFLHETKLTANPLKFVLQNFIRYLQSLKNVVILVGHNAHKFDAPRIFQASFEHGLAEDLIKVVGGVADTYKIMLGDPKLSLEESLKQPDLARKYIPNFNSENAHEGLADCEALEKICLKLDLEKKIRSNIIPFNQFVGKEIGKMRISNNQSQMDPLKGVISDMMINRLSSNNLTTVTLKKIMADGGKKAVEIALTENVDGKPRITKNRKIIDNIVDFLSK